MCNYGVSFVSSSSVIGITVAMTSVAVVSVVVIAVVVGLLLW